MAMVSSPMTSSWFSPTWTWTYVDGKNAIIALLLTLLCGAVEICFYLLYGLGKAPGENLPRKVKWELDGGMKRVKP